MRSKRDPLHESRGTAVPSDAPAAYVAGPGSRRRASGVVVSHPELFLAPAACACCLGHAARPLRVRAVAAHSITVNYCDDCLRHASAARTRILAVCVASVLLGLTTALALPILAAGVGTAWVAGAALLATALPVLLAVAWRRQPRAGHSSRGEAVRWRGREQLLCTNEGYARLAARHNRLERVEVWTPLLSWSSWYWVGPVATLLALPASIMFNTAVVRALNLTASDYTLVVDGHVLAEVPATSAESPAAGREFRLAAGRRHFQAIARDGTLLSDREVFVRGGAQHLYAPGNSETCFWLEFTSYGRQKVHGPQRVELARGVEFWLLSEPVDTWFAPSPLPVADDTRSSGGRLTALRQAPCASELH